MPACLPNRDTLSGWQHPRKPCPRLSAQNGMRFPDGMPSGNRVPESRPRTGHAFRLNAQRKLHPGIDARNGIHFPLRADPETVSHSERQLWDELSARGFSRKRYPTLKRNSGLQFPVEGCSGKCVPFQARIPGCTFRLKLQPESASHSGAEFRDAVSAPSKRPRLAMEPGPKAQRMQLMLSMDSPSVMAVRALPYPR
mgnify:FL=1